MSGVYFVIFAVLAASQMWILMAFLTRNYSVLGYSSLDFLDILDIYHRKDIHLSNIFLVIGL